MRLNLTFLYGCREICLLHKNCALKCSCLVPFVLVPLDQRWPSAVQPQRGAKTLSFAKGTSPTDWIYDHEEDGQIDRPWASINAKSEEERWRWRVKLWRSDAKPLGSAQPFGHLARTRRQHDISIEQQATAEGRRAARRRQMLCGTAHVELSSSRRLQRLGAMYRPTPLAPAALRGQASSIAHRHCQCRG